MCNVALKYSVSLFAVIILLFQIVMRYFILIIHKKLHPGDVTVATNLAGRGTDIKVIAEVNNNGGLFVILSFLSGTPGIWPNCTQR